MEIQQLIKQSNHIFQGMILHWINCICKVSSYKIRTFVTFLFFFFPFLTFGTLTAACIIKFKIVLLWIPRTNFKTTSIYCSQTYWKVGTWGLGVPSFLPDPTSTRQLKKITVFRNIGKGLIDIFSRRVTGFQRCAKALNFFVRKLSAG